MDFTAHLKRQLAFLERSTTAYDAGLHDEAIRMAVVMRVLMHQTANSTSLLTHLNAEQVLLLSTTTGDTPGTVFFFGLGTMRMGPEGFSYYAGLGDGAVKHLMPAPKWWAQVVYVLGPDIRLSRKKIVLSAANQDGGAHVDEKLSREYQELSSTGGLGTFTTIRDGLEHAEPVTNAHFVAIRQMAYELLQSPALISLAGP